MPAQSPFNPECMDEQGSPPAGVFLSVFFHRDPFFLISLTALIYPFPLLSLILVPMCFQLLFLGKKFVDTFYRALQLWTNFCGPSCGAFLLFPFYDSRSDFLLVMFESLVYPRPFRPRLYTMRFVSCARDSFLKRLMSSPQRGFPSVYLTQCQSPRYPVPPISPPSNFCAEHPPIAFLPGWSFILTGSPF